MILVSGSESGVVDSIALVLALEAGLVGAVLMNVEVDDIEPEAELGDVSLDGMGEDMMVQLESE